MPAAEPTASSSSRELESLVSLLQGLSRMSLTMAQNCIEAQAKLPEIFNAAVDAAAAALLDGEEHEGMFLCPHLDPISAIPSVPTETWTEGVARTPDELDAAHPPGTSDDLVYHVVIAGREPGLYASVLESNYQVVGVPDNDRLKQRGRVAALLYYRHMWGLGLVHKMIPESGSADASAAAAARAAPAPAAARATAGPASPRVSAPRPTRQ